MWSINLELHSQIKSRALKDGLSRIQAKRAKYNGDPVPPVSGGLRSLCMLMQNHYLSAAVEKCHAFNLGCS